MVVVLRGKGIRVDYGREKSAVEVAELELAAGDLLCVLGPNGAGKSSLLRALAGLVDAGGEVVVEGESLARLDARARARRIAWLPQSSVAPLQLRVEDLVWLGRHPHRGALAAPSAEDQLAVDRALAEVDLTALRDRRLGTLSGGERRRALLARALAQDARLLLLDEPTTMLDLAHGMAFFGRIAKLAREQNKAIIATTHDLNLASQFADQILLLDRGVVASSGDASRVLRREVLEPVYGPDLECGELPSAAACGTRPFVLSWRRS